MIHEIIPKRQAKTTIYTPKKKKFKTPKRKKNLRDPKIHNNEEKYQKRKKVIKKNKLTLYC